MAGDAEADAGVAPLAALQSSAKGWHGIQLAVLGFIGLCGVLQSGTSKDNPEWVRNVAAALVLSSLVLACAAVVVVGAVAWPVRPAGDAERGAARLRTGIVLTFVAVALLATGATSGWWPVEDDAGSAPSAVELTTRAGVLCGELQQSQPGTVAVTVAGRTVVVAVDDLLSVRPAACG